MTAGFETANGEAGSIARSTNKGYTEKCTAKIDMINYNIHSVWQWIVSTKVGADDVVIKTCTITCRPDAEAPKYLPGSHEDIGSCLAQR